MQHEEIYSQLSERGLMSALVDRVREIRQTTSRNTVYLALRSGGTTSARKMIIRVAQQLLAEVAEPLEILQ